MKQNRLAVVPHALTLLPSRREVLCGLAAAGFGWAGGSLPDFAEAKKNKKRRKKRRKKHQETRPLCTRIGEPCHRAGTNCQERFCLQAPFTIAATWQSESNHDTWLFVPPRDEGTGPRPQIDYDCNQSNSACATQYPFACVNRDASGPGDEITTVYELLPGPYEYWIALGNAPADELTIVLTDRGGRVVRQWANPAKPPEVHGGWHVFDLDGETGRVTSVDAPPGRFPLPSTNVCPE